MKTKEQVIRQLKELKFADEEWGGVQKFLNSVGIKPKRATKSGAISCSFGDFMDWYQHGHGSGDIVGYGRTAVVVSFSFKNNLWYCGYFGLDKELLIPKESLEVGVTDRCKYLNNEEIEPYRNSYYTSRYLIDVVRGELVHKPTPTLGKVYKFLHNGTVNIGCASNISDETVTFGYQYGQEGLNLCKLEVPQCQVFFLVTNTAKLYKEIRDRFGYSWDEKSRQFILLPKRIDKGGIYFYITDRFTVSAAKDGCTVKDDMRYSSGNYFPSKTEAEIFLSIVVEARKKQLKTSATFAGG